MCMWRVSKQEYGFLLWMFRVTPDGRTVFRAVEKLAKAV